MNKKIIVTILFLLFPTLALAGDFICHDGTGFNLRKKISCGRICSTDPNCIRANRSTNIRLKKIVNDQLKDFTQNDIDTIRQAKESQELQFKQAREDSLDKKISGTKLADMNLTKVDNAIDNIGNLNDAKVFLKKLVRYIVANQPSIP